MVVYVVDGDVGSQADYGLEDYVEELNYAAARLAREAAEAAASPDRPRWVAGVLGLFSCTLDADVNDDGQVDVADVMAVAADWHNPAFTPAHDLDDDGDVDIVDLMLVAAHWGETCG